MDVYLQRCLELAAIPGSKVEPNPRVGAVVVHQDTIIGEGWHERFGEAHAEVNAINSVQDRTLLPHSTLYVSLEPCNHRGKTPACTGLILNNKIPKVVIGALDPNPQMAGQSVTLLRNQGVEVLVNPETTPFYQLNSHFRHHILARKPFITLKWAESKDGFMASQNENGVPIRTAISDPQVSRWVHLLRHEHQAIMVGKHTALIDQPSLTTRKWPGTSPIRIFFDRKLEVPSDNPVYGPGKVVVVNEIRNEVVGDVTYFVPVEEEAFDELHMLLTELYGRLQIGSILVEGGPNLLQQFLDQGCWNELWQNVGVHNLDKGLPAPQMPAYAVPTHSHSVAGDLVHLWKNP